MHAHVRTTTSLTHAHRRSHCSCLRLACPACARSSCVMRLHGPKPLAAASGCSSHVSASESHETSRRRSVVESGMRPPKTSIPLGCGTATCAQRAPGSDAAASSAPPLPASFRGVPSPIAPSPSPLASVALVLGKGSVVGRGCELESGLSCRHEYHSAKPLPPEVSSIQTSAARPCGRSAARESRRVQARAPSAPPAPRPAQKRTRVRIHAARAP
eukprot:4137320-Pleurochrysis_carterae.AAC.5